MPLVAQQPNAAPVELTRDSLGFGSYAISEREQFERQDEWDSDIYRSYFSKYMKYFHLKPTFDKAEQKLHDMVKIVPNWDSYGAQPPNREAVASAQEILILLKEQSLAPSAVVPSSEGGVAICFVDSGNYADIECLNTGEILAVTYKGTDEPNVWDVDRQEAAITNTIERIRTHFAA